MNKNIKKVTAYFRARFTALRADESGMEAAQVILILALVLIGLVPVVNSIITRIKTKGSEACTQIDNVGC